MFNRESYVTKFTDMLTLRDLAESTVNNYTSYLNQYLDFIDTSLGGKLPEKVTWEEVRSYILYLKDIRKLNNRSINPHIAQLIFFFKYVLHRDWDRYQVPFLRYDEYLPAVPTKTEMEKIIYSMPFGKYQCIVALMYSAGLRVSEAINLRYEDISFSRMQIHVAKTKNRAERKAILAKKMKNRIYWHWVAAGKPDMSEFIFPGQKPGTHISDESVRRVMKAHLQSIGLGDRGFTPHSCRHCFGLTLYESGADLLAIRDAMGHKSINSTTVYASLGIGSDHGLTSPMDMEG